MFVTHTIAILKTLVAVAIGLMLGYPLYRWSLFRWHCAQAWKALPHPLEWMLDKTAEREN